MQWQNSPFTTILRMSTLYSTPRYHCESLKAFDVILYCSMCMYKPPDTQTPSSKPHSTNMIMLVKQWAMGSRRLHFFFLPCCVISKHIIVALLVILRLVTSCSANFFLLFAGKKTIQHPRDLKDYFRVFTVINL